MTTKDLLKLNGRFTEQRLRSMGFSALVIKEAKQTGFFREVAGSLETIPTLNRERRLPRFTEAPLPPGAPAVPAPASAAPVAPPAPTTPEEQAIQCPHCGSTFDPTNGAPQVGDPAGNEHLQDDPAVAPSAAITGTESLSSLLLKNPRGITEGQYTVGSKVTKNVNGVAIQCVVTAVNGNSYQLVSADGKNTPMTATDADLAVIPPTPEEQQKDKQLAQKTAPATPQGPQNPTSNPLG